MASKIPKFKRSQSNCNSQMPLNEETSFENKKLARTRSLNQLGRLENDNRLTIITDSGDLNSPTKVLQSTKKSKVYRNTETKIGGSKSFVSVYPSLNSLLNDDILDKSNFSHNSNGLTQEDLHLDGIQSTTQENFLFDYPQTTSQANLFSDYPRANFQVDLLPGVSHPTSQGHLSHCASPTSPQGNAIPVISHATSHVSLLSDVSYATSQGNLLSNISYAPSQENLIPDVSYATSQVSLLSDVHNPKSYINLLPDEVSTDSNKTKNIVNGEATYNDSIIVKTQRPPMHQSSSSGIMQKLYNSSLKDKFNSKGPQYIKSSLSNISQKMIIMPWKKYTTFKGPSTNPELENFSVDKIPQGDVQNDPSCSTKILRPGNTVNSKMFESLKSSESSFPNNMENSGNKTSIKRTTRKHKSLVIKDKRSHFSRKYSSTKYKKTTNYLPTFNSSYFFQMTTCKENSPKSLIGSNSVDNSVNKTSFSFTTYTKNDDQLESKRKYSVKRGVLRTANDFKASYDLITQQLYTAQTNFQLKNYNKALSLFRSTLSVMDNIVETAVDESTLSPLDLALCRSIQEIVASVDRKTAIEGFSDSQKKILDSESIEFTWTSPESSDIPPPPSFPPPPPPSLPPRNPSLSPSFYSPQTSYPNSSFLLPSYKFSSSTPPLPPSTPPPTYSEALQDDGGNISGNSFIASESKETDKQIEEPDDAWNQVHCISKSFESGYSSSSGAKSPPTPAPRKVFMRRGTSSNKLKANTKEIQKKNATKHCSGEVHVSSIPKTSTNDNPEGFGSSKDCKPNNTINSNSVIDNKFEDLENNGFDELRNRAYPKYTSSNPILDPFLFMDPFKNEDTAKSFVSSNAIFEDSHHNSKFYLEPFEKVDSSSSIPENTIPLSDFEKASNEFFFSDNFPFQKSNEHVTLDFGNSSGISPPLEPIQLQNDDQRTIKHKILNEFDPILLSSPEQQTATEQEPATIYKGQDTTGERQDAAEQGQGTTEQGKDTKGQRQDTTEQVDHNRNNVCFENEKEHEQQTTEYDLTIDQSTKKEQPFSVDEEFCLFARNIFDTFDSQEDSKDYRKLDNKENSIERENETVKSPLFRKKSNFFDKISKRNIDDIILSASETCSKLELGLKKGFESMNFHNQSSVRKKELKNDQSIKFGKSEFYESTNKTPSSEKWDEILRIEDSQVFFIKPNGDIISMKSNPMLKISKESAKGTEDDPPTKIELHLNDNLIWLHKLEKPKTLVFQDQKNMFIFNGETSVAIKFPDSINETKIAEFSTFLANNSKIIDSSKDEDNENTERLLLNNTCCSDIFGAPKWNVDENEDCCANFKKDVQKLKEISAKFRQPSISSQIMYF